MEVFNLLCCNITTLIYINYYFRSLYVVEWIQIKFNWKHIFCDTFTILQSSEDICSYLPLNTSLTIWKCSNYLHTSKLSYISSLSKLLKLIYFPKNYNSIRPQSKYYLYISYLWVIWRQHDRRDNVASPNHAIYYK